MYVHIYNRAWVCCCLYTKVSSIFCLLVDEDDHKLALLIPSIFASILFQTYLESTVGKYCTEASLNSFLGSASKSLVPPGVHWAITDTQKNDSLASNCANVLGLFNLVLWLLNTLSTLTNLLLSIALEGRGLFEYKWDSGSGSAEGFITAEVWYGFSLWMLVAFTGSDGNSDDTSVVELWSVQLLLVFKFAG